MLQCVTIQVRTVRHHYPYLGPCTFGVRKERVLVGVEGNGCGTEEVHAKLRTTLLSQLSTGRLQIQNSFKSCSLTLYTL